MDTQSTPNDFSPDVVSLFPVAQRLDCLHTLPPLSLSLQEEHRFSNSGPSPLLQAALHDGPPHPLAPVACLPYHTDLSNFEIPQRESLKPERDHRIRLPQPPLLLPLLLE